MRYVPSFLSVLPNSSGVAFAFRCPDNVTHLRCNHHDLQRSQPRRCFLSALAKSESGDPAEPMKQSQILGWVSNIHVGSEPLSSSLITAKTSQVERKRPLPPPSISSSDGGDPATQGKRLRTGPDQTPRANPLLSTSSDASSAASSSGYDVDCDDTGSAGSKRTRTSNSSPTKITHTLVYLHIEHVIQYKAFDGRESASAPASLKELVASIEADAFGQGIISAHDLVGHTHFSWMPF